MDNKPIQKKSFEKDTAAHEIVQLMIEDNYSEMPDSYKASQVGLSLDAYQSYMSDPLFLRWAVKKMQDLYLTKLPELMNTMFQQALKGQGRQQKMLLEFMKISNKEEETKSSNIVIVNQIPNPDQKSDDPQVIDITGDVNGRVPSI